MIERLMKGRVKDVPPYVPGKSKEEAARGHGLSPKEIVKLASNENPLGPSRIALEEIRKATRDLSLYPDSGAEELRAGIAEYVGARKENIVVGNGSDELMDLLAKVFLGEGDEVVIPVPTFPLYESIALLYGARPVFVPLGKDFRYEVEPIVKAIGRKTRLVFLCSPNNPTGTVLGEKDLRRVLEKKVVVVLDEAYVEFADRSYVPLVREYENLVVLRTFSKAFGLAGLRVGYGVADGRVAEALMRARLPFNVGLLAQMGAIGALRDKRHLERTVGLVKKGRAFLARGLSAMGVEVYPSGANFLLLDLRGRGKEAREVAEGLLRRGIITRECQNFRGLDGYYLRVSVGTMAQNRRFLREMEGVLSA